MKLKRAIEEARAHGFDWVVVTHEKKVVAFDGTPARGGHQTD